MGFYIHSMTTPPKFSIDEREVEFNAIRAQGAGGQNVNKVSSAIHLRFDIHASSLPDEIKARLLGFEHDDAFERKATVAQTQEARLDFIRQ